MTMMRSERSTSHDGLGPNAPVIRSVASSGRVINFQAVASEMMMGEQNIAIGPMVAARVPGENFPRLDQVNMLCGAGVILTRCCSDKTAHEII